MQNADARLVFSSRLAVVYASTVYRWTFYSRRRRNRHVERPGVRQHNRPQPARRNAQDRQASLNFCRRRRGYSRARCSSTHCPYCQRRGGRDLGVSTPAGGVDSVMGTHVRPAHHAATPADGRARRSSATLSTILVYRCQTHGGNGSSHNCHSGQFASPFSITC